MKSIIVYAFLLAANFSYAEGNDCELMINFIDTSTKRDYDTLHALKDACSWELQFGPTAQLTAIAKRMDINSDLTVAHDSRLNKRMVILDASNSITSSTLNASMTRKLAFTNGELVSQIQRMHTLLERLKNISNDDFYSYIPAPLSTTIEICTGDEKRSLTDEAVKLCSSVQAKIKHTQSLSSNSTSVVDGKIDKLLTTGATSITQLKSGLANASAQQLNNDILASISDVRISYQVSRAWDLFILKSGGQTALRLAKTQLNSGQITRGLSNLDLLETLQVDFLAGLPSRLRKSMEDNQSKDLTNQIIALRDFSSKLTPSQIEFRLKQYITFRGDQYVEIRQACKAFFIKQTSDFNKIDSDLKLVKSIDSLKLDKKIVLFVYDSLAERLDIAMDVCRGE